MDFLKGIGGKIVGGVVALLVIGGAVSWWQLDPSARSAIFDHVGKIFGWLGLVLALPWVGFAVIGRVARMDSNAMSGLLILTLTGAEAVTLAWLFGFAIAGRGEWVGLITASLFAGVYNLFACDWIAEKAA